MKSKKKTLIIAISLLVVAVCLFLAAPVVGILVVLVAAGILFGRMDDVLKEKQKSTAAGSMPLSVAVNNDLRIVSDCVNLLNTSPNLQTVISRYDTLVSALQRLTAYEGNPAVSFPREQPSAALSRISAEKPEIFNRAIQRAYDRVLHECAALKTEKGRRNRHKKFFAELSDLMDSFPPATREFAAQFILDNQDDPLTGLEGL